MACAAFRLRAARFGGQVGKIIVMRNRRGGTPLYPGLALGTARTTARPAPHRLQEKAGRLGGRKCKRVHAPILRPVGGVRDKFGGIRLSV